MKSKKVICALIICSFVLSMVLTVSVYASPEDTKVEKVYSYLVSAEDKPEGKPGKPAPIATVNIRNIPSGDKLTGNVLIVAQATGTFSSVVFQIDQGADQTMTVVDSSGRYEASWLTSSVGPHTLTVKAEDSSGSVVASSSVSVTVVSGPLYEVTYEIDYMVGHLPETAVLNYLKSYWLQHAISVTFNVDDQVSDPTDDGYISSSDFWALEHDYNDGPTNSLKYGYQYTLSDKWMLYGTYDSNLNVGGYCYVSRVGRDSVGGNYIFIADGMIESWQRANSIPSNGGEVIVTGHEMGHSIGILVGAGGEKYDSDSYSIMSYMRLQNAKAMENYWYYSREYWATANLNYYA